MMEPENWIVSQICPKSLWANQCECLFRATLQCDVNAGDAFAFAIQNLKFKVAFDRAYGMTVILFEHCAFT